MVDFQILYGIDTIHELSSEWEQLYQLETNREASDSYCWTKALIESELEPSDKFFVIKLTESDETVGLVPMLIRRQKGFRSLKTLSELYHTHSDLLLKYPSKEITVAFLKALRDVQHKWDVYSLSSLIGTNPLIPVLDQSLEELNFSYKLADELQLPIVHFTGDYQEYLGGLSRNARTNIKRKKRKLENLGKIRIEELREENDIDRFLSDLLQVEEGTWKRLEGSSIKCKDNTIALYRNLIESGFRENNLFLGILYLDDSPISYNLGISKDEVFYFLKTSYHREFAEASPSHTLISHMFESLIKRGIKVVDFGGPIYETWQSRWTKDSVEQKSLVVYGNTIMSKLYVLLKNSKIILARLKQSASRQKA